MKFNSACVFSIWDREVLTAWRKSLLNVKRKSTQLKGIVSHDDGDLNANYPKMSRFTHKFRENIAINFQNVHPCIWHISKSARRKIAISFLTVL